MSVPELKRAICPGCGVDLYLHRIDDYWVCPECKHKTPVGPRCPKGHDMSGDNMYLHLDGHDRYQPRCAVCERERKAGDYRRTRASASLPYTPGRPGPKPRTHCKRGHAFTPGNTIERDNGDRRCRSCALDYQFQYRNRQRLAKASS